jgi:hypothetical protein
LAVSIAMNQKVAVAIMSYSEKNPSIVDVSNEASAGLMAMEGEVGVATTKEKELDSGSSS